MFARIKFWVSLACNPCPAASAIVENLAHDLEIGLGGFERRLIAADHEGQRRFLRRPVSTGTRRIRKCAPLAVNAAPISFETAGEMVLQSAVTLPLRTPSTKPPGPVVIRRAIALSPTQ
jgi:hypothetical protein